MTHRDRGFSRQVDPAVAPVRFGALFRVQDVSGASCSAFRTRLSIGVSRDGFNTPQGLEDHRLRPNLLNC